jgi:hypothetical protein
MKFLIFITLVACCFGATDAQIIQALEMTEASYGKIGRAGEVLPSQLSPATVHDHGMDPLANLRWLKKEFAKRGVAQLPFNYALAWNAGLTGATTGRAPISSYRYACRMVANLETITHHGSRPAAVSPSMTATQPVVFILQPQ